MTFRSILLGLLATCAPLASARAEPVNLAAVVGGTTYFNRPGSSLEQHDRDLRACLLTATENSLVLGPGDGGLVKLTGREYAKRVRVENCMVVRGWRIVQLAPDQIQIWDNLDQPALADRLASLVGADTPPGAVMRRWDNDAAKPETLGEAFPVKFAGRSLSIDALPPDPAFAARLLSAQHPTVPYKRYVVRPTTVEKLVAGPDDAVIVLTIRGDDSRRRAMVGLLRLGPDPFTPPPDEAPVGYNPDLWHAKPGSDGMSERTYAFVASPGRWALSMLGGAGFCLGAPYFDLKPGQVVYAGLFDFSRDLSAPDMSLERPREMLAAQNPDAASRLSQAAWINGAAWSCVNNNYAFDMPGAPYEPGYVRPGLSR